MFISLSLVTSLDRTTGTDWDPGKKAQWRWRSLTSASREGQNQGQYQVPRPARAPGKCISQVMCEDKRNLVLNLKSQNYDQAGQVGESSIVVNLLGLQNNIIGLAKHLLHSSVT